MNLQSRPTERSQLCLCRAGNAVLVRLPFGVPAFLDAFCGGIFCVMTSSNDKLLVLFFFSPVRILYEIREKIQVLANETMPNERLEFLRVRIQGHPFGYMDTPWGYRDTP